MKRRRQAGFSLIEALITLLVLSIGLLGLGRLQARLWQSSSELHAMTQAFLFANNVLETRSVDWPTIPPQRPGKALTESRFSFTVSRSQPPSAGGLADTRVNLVWRRPARQHTLTLSISHADLAPPADARWLLPPPH